MSLLRRLLSHQNDEAPIGPVQEEWIEKASCIRDYWADKVGSYADTDDGLEDITFTELNKRRARARVARMEELIKRGHRGALTEDDADEIKRAYRRLPREFKP